MCDDFCYRISIIFLKKVDEVLNQLNVFLTRYMPILTPLSLVVGVLLESVGQHLLFLVAWLFALMTFISSLGMKFTDVKVFARYPKTILSVIAFLHILMPLWAFTLSEFIFDDHLLTLGFVLAVAVPTGVTSIIWVTVSKGNVPLCLAIVLIDTLLAPIVMPILIYFVAGKSIQIDSMSLIVDLIWMIVIPSILGVLVNERTKGHFNQKYGQILAPISKLCLFMVVMINSSAIAPYLKNMNVELFLVILVVGLLTISGYFFAMVIGKFVLRDEGVGATILFTGGMRNIALGVVIATTYFPATVAMPVVFGMLFQQIMASLFLRWNVRWNVSNE